MTIDRMDARVDVAPGGAGADRLGSVSGPASPGPAPTQGTQELLAALRPLVVQIVESELQLRMRIAGLR